MRLTVGARRSQRVLAGRRAFIAIGCSVVSTVAGELCSLVSTAANPYITSEIHLLWPLGCAWQAIQGTCWGLIHMQVHATKDPCMSAGRCTGLVYLLGARIPPWGASAAARSHSQQSYHQSRRKWPLVTKQGPNGHFDVTEYPYLNIYMYF